MTTADHATRKPRPLSPHLSIYKPIPTMVMSILHRITGAALYIGTPLAVWWLLAIAAGPESYATAKDFFGSILGILILFGYTWALIHHMLGGLKHLMQDTGTGLEKHFTTSLAIAHIIASLALTVLLWILGAIIV